MSRTANAGGQLRLERLERRAMMAGDVSAQILGGILSIQGDDASDSLSVTEVAPSTIEITGANGTTINGQTAPVEITGVTGNIGIHLGDGADQVNVTNVAAPQGLFINLGDGNNTVNVNNVSVAQVASLTLGGGNNVVNLSAAASTPTNGAPSGVQVNDLLVQLGGGTNQLALDETSVSGAAVLSVGGGKNTINIGNAAATSASNPFDVVFGNHLSVFTGNGGDTVHFNNVNAEYILVTTGSGNDTVSFSKSDVETVFAILGQGDDTFDLSGGGNDFETMSALGGPGNDTFHEGPNNEFGRRAVYGFEFDS